MSALKILPKVCPFPLHNSFYLRTSKRIYKTISIQHIQTFSAIVLGHIRLFDLSHLEIHINLKCSIFKKVISNWFFLWIWQGNEQIN